MEANIKIDIDMCVKNDQCEKTKALKFMIMGGSIEAKLHWSQANLRAEGSGEVIETVGDERKTDVNVLLTKKHYMEKHHCS